MIFKHILLLIYFQISRYGKGKAANYIVPKVVFGDIDADNPPIPAIMATNSDARLTRASVAASSASTARYATALFKCDLIFCSFYLSRERRPSVVKGTAKRGKVAISTQARSRQSSNERSESVARCSSSTTAELSKRRSSNIREEGSVSSASNGRHESRSRSQNNDACPVDPDQTTLQPLRSISLRSTRLVARGEADDESIVEVPPLK